MLQCSNNDCKTFTGLPTSERIIQGKARLYDVNRGSALAMQIIQRGRAALTKFYGCNEYARPGGKELQLMLERMKPWILLFLVMERGQEEDFSLSVVWFQLFMWTKEEWWTMK